MIALFQEPIVAEDPWQDVEMDTLILGESQHHEISNVWERHIYQFSANRTDAIAVHVIPLNPVHMSVSIFTVTGEEIERVFTDNLGLKEGEEFTVDIVLPNNGSYKIMVDMTDRYLGEYEIEVSDLESNSN